MASVTSQLEEWLIWSLSPKISAILLTLLISVLSPVIFHYVLYRKGASSSPPSFLLLGPSSSGKTALYTLLSGGAPAKTHTSQEPQTSTCTLPSNVKIGSQQFRSQNDPSANTANTFQLTDTPGHGKLRSIALAQLDTLTSLQGIVFVVDAAMLSSQKGMTDAATFLYDVLLKLQHKYESSAGSSQSKAMTVGSPLGVLIAANKSDLFTSLPPHLVRSGLESELGKIRGSRAKGLLQVQMNDDDNDDQYKEWLGPLPVNSQADATNDFAFDQVGEAGIDVQVVAGNVIDGKGRAGSIDDWSSWIGQQL